MKKKILKLYLIRVTMGTALGLLFLLTSDAPPWAATMLACIVASRK